MWLSNRLLEERGGKKLDRKVRRELDGVAMGRTIFKLMNLVRKFYLSRLGPFYQSGFFLGSEWIFLEYN